MWIGGDANLFDVNWASDTINGHHYSVPINQTYIDTINDMGCEQLVGLPTKLENTLDIFCTKRPTLIDRCLPLPGFSDHDMVLVDTGIIPKRQKLIQRRIYLWKRADKAAMKKELDEFSSNLTSSHDTSTPVNTLWSLFKQRCTEKRERLRSYQNGLNATEPALVRQTSQASVKTEEEGLQESQKVQAPNRLDQIQGDTERPPDYMQKCEDRICTRHDQGTGSKNKKLYSYCKSMTSDSSGVAIEERWSELFRRA